MLSRILVPLDGSPAMAAIVPAVRQLVSGTGAVVHLLVVRPPLRDLAPREGPLVHLDEVLRQELAAWNDYLTRKGSQLAYDGIVVEREVRFGDALVETLAVAQRHAMHLIALAVQPQFWLQRLRRPNLAHRLLTQALIPVLAVPPQKARLRGAFPRYGSVPL